MPTTDSSATRARATSPTRRGYPGTWCSHSSMRGCEKCLLWLLLPALIWGCHNNVKNAENLDPEPGVALTLATQRAQAITGLSYDLTFTIPMAPSAPVTGHEIIRFSTKDIARPLVLDFSPGAEYLTSVS